MDKQLRHVTIDLETTGTTPTEIYLNTDRLCKRSNINEVIDELQK